MNRGRGPAGSDFFGAVSPSDLRQNRLRRKNRLSQAEAPELGCTQNQQRTTDFKTPTRILGYKTSTGLTGESPHSDSDFQHDIIWDAASPSPNRLGRKGRKQATAAVNISEIVSRIAPKHGRPEITEPTLQQWMGDSFAIPCTPDVQAPKPKKKSPRVDDLLKLAKQFDFNMFRQDEEEADSIHEKSLELLSEDILNFEKTTFLPVTSLNAGPQDDACNAIVNKPADEDLDFLFDGPTQHVSGNLTPVSQSQAPLVKADFGLCGKTPPAGISKNGSAANDKFEDDWENDDLLNDSLVFEMTQNPQKFISPMYCSTQKPPGGTTTHSELAFSAVKKKNVQKRATFKLESNHHVRERTFQTDSPLSQISYDVNVQVRKTSTSNLQTSRLPASKVLGSKSDTDASMVTASPRLQKACHTGSALLATTGLADFLDDDLDAIFASDPAWDDPTDDNLLCEMCEDLENNIQGSENVTTKQIHLPNKRAPLQPANYHPLPNKDTPKGLLYVSSRPAPTVLTGTSVSKTTANAGVTGSFRFTQTKTSLGTTHLQRGSNFPMSTPAVLPTSSSQITHKKQFHFKKPNTPPDKVPRKCTAVEIELKKRQAMERRQQKLQAQAQNF